MDVSENVNETREKGNVIEKNNIDVGIKKGFKFFSDGLYLFFKWFALLCVFFVLGKIFNVVLTLVLFVVFDGASSEETSKNIVATVNILSLLFSYALTKRVYAEWKKKEIKNS